MAFRRDRNEELPAEQVAAFLKDAVSKIKANPEEFENLKKVFKQNVPLTMRSYVAAYLINNCRGAIFHFNSRKNREEFRARREFRSDFRNEERRPRFGENEAASEGSENTERREPYARVQIAPDQAATVFVSIGRNRRVFPRDLVGLFTNAAGIEREKIGNIRVLSNYSFVELFKEDAEKAIEKLNGYDYRGRALSVSYSRQRDEESEDEAPRSYEENNEPVPNVENRSAPIVDNYTTTTNDTVAQQAAFAAQMESSSMTDEEILAARAPRSSSSED